MRFDETIETRCDTGVYEPAEDSRLMIKALAVVPGEKVLEIGCGTGIIALHCAKAGARVTASDASPDAVRCARANAMRNKLDLEVVESDLFGKIDGVFDEIIFNPPYLPEEGSRDQRWSGGASGIETTMRFLERAKDHLSERGRVHTIVSSLANAEGFEDSAERLGYDHRIITKEHIFSRIWRYMS